MKKIFFSIIIGLLFTTLFISCEDVNDQFKGLDDLTETTNVAKYLPYTLTSSNYSTIATKIQKPTTDIINLYQDTINVYKDSLKRFAEDKADSTRMNTMITGYNNKITTLKTNDPIYLLGASVKSGLCLNSKTPSDVWIPVVLNSQYPRGDVGSSISVTYNYNLDNLGYLSAFSGAVAYSVSTANYTSVGGKVAKLGAFTPSYPSVNFIPNFLNTGISSPTEGKIALVSYKATNTEPNMDDIPTVYTKFSEDFTAGNLDKFVAYSVSGDQVWGASSKYAKMTGFVNPTSYENEDWLIIPSMDLSTAVTASLSFVTSHKYAGNVLGLKYSTDYAGSGDPSLATWNTLNFNYEPGLPSSWTWTSSGNINLPSMPNSNVSIAFIYKSTATESSTWEVDNILVTYKDLNSDIPVKTYNDCYKFTNSTWVKTSDVTCISAFEYEEIGVPNGYFSTTNLPTSYLPLYLKNKYPLALQGDTTVVIYNYGSTTTPAAAKYTYSSGAWSTYTGIVPKTEQFVISSIGWVFDPTVKYTMVTADYGDMVTYASTHLTNYYDGPNTSEYYYGFSSKYTNVSFRLSYRTTYLQYDTELAKLTTNAEKSTLLWNRLKEGVRIFLERKFPSAVPQVNGVDVEYHVTLKVYYPDCESNITNNYTFKYKCTAAGAPPTFEFISYAQV